MLCKGAGADPLAASDLRSLDHRLAALLPCCLQARSPSSPGVGRRHAYHQYWITPIASCAAATEGCQEQPWPEQCCTSHTAPHGSPWTVPNTFGLARVAWGALMGKVKPGDPEILARLVQPWLPTPGAPMRPTRMEQLSKAHLCARGVRQECLGCQEAWRKELHV